MHENDLTSRANQISRRRLLHSTAAAAAASAVGWANCTAAAADRATAGPAVTKGRIKQSIVQWCYANDWDIEPMCQVAQQLGCRSVELVPAKDWHALKKHKLVCALANSHLFVQGMNNPRYQPMCIEMIKNSIDSCADAGFPTVITFTGFAEETGPWADGGNPDLTKLGDSPRRKIDPDEGAKNCVAGYKKVVGYAEKKKINLSLEMLNSRDGVEMKGHPGYQGDHVDYCMEIINQVGSPRLGLLFDIYHVQIMDGDLIRRIGECKEAINHVHTAGNPGRNELDENQEIYYPAVMKALIDIGYQGYVGQEFIPTRDAFEGLTQAVKLCDV